MGLGLEQSRYATIRASGTVSISRSIDPLDQALVAAAEPIRSAIVPSLRPCAAANSTRSGRRAIVPSSFMISHSTAAGCSPASCARSQHASVWPAREHAARLGDEREDVTRLHDVVRARGRRRGDADGVRAIGGGDAGGDAARRLDRHGEGGAVHRAVRRHHRREAELPRAALGDRHADEPAAVPP